MANIKSAQKRMRNAEKSRLQNRAVRSKVGSLQRRLLDAVASGDRSAAEAVCREYCSALDKAAKTNRVKANTVSRRKSRAARMIARLAAA
ncbi:MAG: 30S ribosomal protein S20 [Lentisphaerae bacterium]|nr:30S ribosomal protein S20 [Lentisphaerota bacterium]